ncbi:hypothetical protein J2T57_001480 [Natronocella acetinitrilica]|uniref:Uncharacterized protein n=1 Tax=Natronocella acetinitrilica TaxID=414046 RepID=A0AAE3G397_9GAMM|nr:hypothetical protein [Natronocella acetinitrilica]MCP1674378.1 hypothetical protein [Natronocella acetinitrilica]
MSVTVYDDNNPHPGGFKGIRLSYRSLERGQRQRYYAFARYAPTREAQARLEAYVERLDARVKRLNASMAERTGADQVASERSVTGVRGISAGFAVTRKRNGRVYHYPAFQTPGRHHYIGERQDYEAAWRAAAEHLVALGRAPCAEEIAERMPGPEVFEVAREERVAAGEAIPRKALPKGPPFANRRAYPTDWLEWLSVRVGAELERRLDAGARDDFDPVSLEERLRAEARRYTG